jgi:hypothetical protein
MPLILALLVACGPKAPANERPGPTETGSDSSPTMGDATGHTGMPIPGGTGTTGDTGQPIDPWDPPLTGPLEPHTIIEAPGHNQWGLFSLGVSVANGPDILASMFYRPDYATEPYGSYFLTGPFPRGSHHVDAIWDGVSGWEAPLEIIVRPIHTVPDTDGDGIEDYWLYHRLVPGPLMGRYHPFYKRKGDDSIAFIERANITSSVQVLAANFDANHDGIDDILVGSDAGQAHFVRWGPFVDRVSYYDDDELGGYLGLDQCQDVYGVTHLPDFYGPGRDGIAYGGVDFPLWCDGADVAFFELDVLPGETNADRLAVLNHGAKSLHSVGDVDGDGHPDVLWAFALDSHILPGPLYGEILDQDQAAVDLLPVTGGAILRPLGDLNGDGTTDFLVLEEGTVEQFVHLSPFAPPLIPSHGLPVEPSDATLSTNLHDLSVGDFDDDGLDDFAFQRLKVDPTDYFEPTFLVIYSGADITATWNARGLPAPPATDTGASDTGASDTGATN